MISSAIALSDKITIGITTDEFAKEARGSQLQSFEERRRGVVEYVSAMGAASEVRIVPLEDPFGPASSDQELQAIFVTVDTVGNAMRLNIERRRRGLPSLEIVIVPKVFAEGGGFVSSTRIREGQMDCEGRLIHGVRGKASSSSHEARQPDSAGLG